MGVLSGLEPKNVFEQFEKLCEIPHGSGNTAQISNYLRQWAQERNLWCIQDPIGNVIIRCEATTGYENVAPYILQGHMDMVAVKDPDCTIDMEQEGIQLEIEGDYITAKGTSLGGDDGIAVAYALAIMDSDTIPHPMLEVVLTIDEETGMEGANGIDLSVLQGRQLLNLDSEDEGILLTSCAGGVRITSTIPVAYREQRGDLYRLHVSGLLGGHSGNEIDKGRANANVLLGKTLFTLQNQVSIGIAGMEGGQKDNVIPNSASTEIVLNTRDVETIENAVKEMEQYLNDQFKGIEEHITLQFEKVAENAAAQVLSEDSMRAVIDYLTLQPDGVQEMSKQMEGLVETSLNLGVIRLDQKEFTASQLIRSSVMAKKDQLREKVSFITKEVGGTVAAEGDYPAWEYKEHSPLREHMIEVFSKMYGHAPKVEAIHAGLECGILAGKLPGLDCVSIGPDMQDIHTTSEKLSISSTKRVWEYLLQVLAG